MIRRIITIVVGGIALWITLLVIFSFVYGPKAGQRVAARIADSLHAEAKVGTSNLALVRGRLELEQLAVHKEDLGHLSLAIADIFCDLPPLGLALLDHECRDLEIRGMRLEVSTAAVFQFQRPHRAPLHVGHVVIDDAVLAFSPSAFLPSLGKIEIKIEHAEAAPTTFKTPLSWIFTMRELRATLELPASITLHLGYKNGRLTAQGGVFGSTPVELPVEIPVALSADDAHDEIKKLVQLGRDLAERLVARRAQDWLKSKLSLP